MNSKESNVTKIAKEALVKAAKKGEDLSMKVFAISYDAVITSLRSLRNCEITDEIKTTIAQDALSGIVEGANELNVSSPMLINFAELGIEEGIKVGSINE